MKNNKLNLRLVTASLMCLAYFSPVRAEVLLSGYVSTSFRLSKGGKTSKYYGFTNNKQDNSFALDVVSLTLASPKTSSEWSAGYNVQLWLGPDAGNKAQIKNAYIDLNFPIGNGIKAKLGRFDTILGKESMDYNKNPHFSHSWGFAIEPTTHEGISASYNLTNEIKLTIMAAKTIEIPTYSVIILNTVQDLQKLLNHRSYGASINYGDPDSTYLDVSYIERKIAYTQASIKNLYVGLGLPLVGDKINAGITWDSRKDSSGNSTTGSVVGTYLDYSASEKMKLKLRGERANYDKNPNSQANAWGATVTASYVIWDKTSTRIEYRHTALDSSSSSNELFTNIIYEF